LIGNISIVLLLGIINLVLLIFQVATGLRYFKVRLIIHRRTGILLFFMAILHAVIALFF
jgi:hypothetical protein